MKNIFWFILLLAGLSCNNTVSKNPKEEVSPVKLIKYYIRYIEQSKELQLESKFYNQNDSVFAVPGGIFVLDNKMDIKNLPREGWMHRLILRPTDYANQYVFSYSFKKGLEKKDTVIFPIYNDFKIETPVISKKTGGLVTWKGEALGQEDGLTMVFEDASGMSYTINHTGLSRGPQVEIRPEALEVFAKGKAILRIVHKRTSIDKIGDTRMIRLTEYYRTPVEIEITD